MAKIKSQHGGEVARVGGTDGSEVILTSDGRRLAKVKGGRWTLRSRFSAIPKGTLRNAYIVHSVNRLTERGYALLYLQANLAGLSGAENFADLVYKAMAKLERAKAVAAKREIERRVAWEETRAIREQQQREVEQHAAKAVEVRQATSHAICCTACGGVLDQSTTVYAKFISGDAVTPHAVALHGACFDGLVGSGRHYQVVADGRLIPAHLWKHSTESLVGYAIVANAGAR